MIKRSLILVAAAVIVIIALAVIAGYTGNVAIRRVQQQSQTVTFTLNQPVVPGVDTVVRWEAPTGATNAEVLLTVRTQTGAVTVGQGHLADRVLTVPFPCELDYTQATLVLTNQQTGEILTWTPLLTLPPGQDCIK